MPKVKKTESDKFDLKSCKGALRASLPVDLWQTIKSENMALSDIYRTLSTFYRPLIGQCVGALTSVIVISIDILSTLYRTFIGQKEVQYV